MTKLKVKIIKLANQKPGLTDREITNLLSGEDKPQQSINQASRALESQDILVRQIREDGKIGNYPTGKQPEIKKIEKSSKKKCEVEALSEDEIKEVLDNYLKSEGWITKIAWGRKHGIDIEAIQGNNKWIIEVKGPGSSHPMRVNYFIGILGETLQRMEDPDAKYSIAFPDLAQYHGLWNRLPKLAKKRTNISILFIDEKGNINEEK